MNTASLMLYFFELAAAVSALSLIFIRNVFHGALLMVICLLSVGGLYVLMFAEFIGIAQIVVYAGGILVIIIFGIMITSKISGKPMVVENTRMIGGLLSGVLFFGLLTYAFTTHTFNTGIFADGLVYQSVQRMGIDLMSDYVLPFEIAGILLLVALVGSAVVASTKSDQP